MGKLEIKEHKKLVLKNVLIHKKEQLEIEKFEKEIEELHQRFKLIGVQTFGPLVVKTSGVRMSSSGGVTVDYEFYIQAHNYKEFANFFEIQDQFVCENCVYVRFEGSVDRLQLAYSKLDIFFYENNLESDGASYTVYLKAIDKQMIVDIFKPVISL